MHDWLLKVDGLDAIWESQTLPVSSQWEGELDDVDCQGLSPNPLLLATTQELPPQTYDTSGMGTGSDVIEADPCEEHPVDIDREALHVVLIPNGEVKHVLELILVIFHSQNVKHFDILFKQIKIWWPVRKGLQPMLK